MHKHEIFREILPFQNISKAKIIYATNYFSRKSIWLSIKRPAIIVLVFFFFFFTLYDFLRFYFSRFDQIIKTEMEKHEFLPDGVSIAL